MSEFVYLLALFLKVARKGKLITVAFLQQNANYYLQLVAEVIIACECTTCNNVLRSELH